MSLIWQEKLLTQNISINTSADNVVITPGQGEMPAAWDNPATYIAIDHMNLVPNAAVTLQIKNGATTDANNGTVAQTNYGGAYSLTANQGWVLENAFQNPDGVVTLKPNKSLVLNLGGAVQVSGFIRYRILSSN
jgi:hypothetical protein